MDTGDFLGLVGRSLGSYEVVRLLGVGGMAYVYEGRHRALGRRVAIKVARREFCEADGTFLERFEREARTAATLNHRHIVNVHDVGEEGGLHYFVMDYVEGEDLASKIRREGRIPLAQALEWARQVGEALDHAHSQGFIHRDVKPQNILIGTDGEAKVTDFGIARAAEGTRLSRSGATIGTAEYMSPEQAGGLPIDHRTDIYSLGVVVYEMLSGRVPFSGTNPVAVATQHLNVAPPPLSGLVSLPEGVEWAVLRALAKDPRERYDNCAEFVRALVEGENARVSTGPLPHPQPTVFPEPADLQAQPAHARRAPNYGVLLSIVAVAGLVAMGVYLLTTRGTSVTGTQSGGTSGGGPGFGNQGSGGGGTSGGGPRQDTGYLHRRTEEWASAWNRREMSELAAFYTEDTVGRMSGGGWTSRQGMVQRRGSAWQGVDYLSVTIQSDIQVTFQTDLAETVFTLDFEASGPNYKTGRYSSVHTKHLKWRWERGDWFICEEWAEG